MADEAFKIEPAARKGTEELIAYMGEDETLEITPKSVRLRKAVLDGGLRARMLRTKKQQQQKR